MQGWWYWRTASLLCTFYVPYCQIIPLFGFWCNSIYKLILEYNKPLQRPIDVQRFMY